MQDLGLVSIIMPSYNCGRFIRESVESVMCQTYTNWELLIQEDASKDDSVIVIQQLAAKDNRIKFECNEQGSGAAISRNRALQRAKGRWVAFLDSDDVWLPEKLEHQIRFMVENDYAFTYHDYTKMNEEGKPLGIYVSGIKKVSAFDMYACCWPGCLAVMYDARKVGLIQIRDVRKNNDTALWFKIIHKYPCYLLKENLAKYRVRANSITPPTLWQRIWAHYPLFRVAEQMNPITATFWTLANVIGNGWKKLFYIKNIL